MHLINKEKDRKKQRDINQSGILEENSLNTIETYKSFYECDMYY